ncbi:MULTISPECIES: substrate-binding periplasmic protein [unclassified Undibacterium]|uniref:substrate-binding periplasmic protein n=1 Tax=unclassified Undibacterium TaxID=2630295 RepID=UPI002AC8A9E5|nr:MULTISPECIES: transporter substrate-binding domain-containing protein [unclassified Undibacterium]MEB0138184.1 transporter substrate-binding domain-containing protein [Undibacterium sp. CCC2.1]MEB0171061.1 transporter substrate-binding domain-containing protein [Undibacterium sp. CCC1.1]MEB0175106.1 transporter substrate-binding domain-containing protein [Undibacterium sp. CCC3.4]MEB0214310.1 transporter substrate-binding domain-containing protein [Undibacterium sp. 5I2]WPX41890.1 transport
MGKRWKSESFGVLRLLGMASLLCAQLWAATAVADECKKLIATGNPEYPPFLWRNPDDDSHLIGASTELMQAIAAEIGIPIEVRYVGPWARVQEEAKLGHVDLLAGAFLTIPRMEYMDYFYPRLRETRSVIWTRKNSRMTYRNWSDLAGKTGITVINNSFGEEFDRYAKESLKFSTVPSLEQAFLLLNMSRADYLIYEEDPGLAYVAKLNMTNIKALDSAITNENLYLTLSHKSPCNTPELRGRIAKALYKLDKQNLMNKLVASNIQLWRKQQSK